ncbi:putative cytosolic protein [Granulibacter bethesdensis]|uniref:Cytosolic protein n=1 Tax=Granulibacter bethesdensis TaxID=364410 RepID=A0AAN0RDS8_9PROT|nr:FkbM family methyltransferase [Granulibacter bethesdensis]AHJ62997.1 putative cytosolic protein [Granulibacter bethesdensis]
MSRPIHRSIAFILTSTDHGTMILNRNDHHIISPETIYGVGHDILRDSSFNSYEVELLLNLLTLRRHYFGDGVFAIDGGANIGVHTVEWARYMTGWGRVLSFEAQEVVYYALAGNIVINNCLNARAKLAAIGENVGELTIPQPDYFSAGSFGSLEIKERPDGEFIGQPISYAPSDGVSIPMLSIDSLELDRVDFIKLDIEGMEIEALRGAQETIEKSRPILFLEMAKSDSAEIYKFLNDNNYNYFEDKINLFALHKDDPVWPHISHNANKVPEH